MELGLVAFKHEPLGDVPALTTCDTLPPLPIPLSSLPTKKSVIPFRKLIFQSKPVPWLATWLKGPSGIEKD